MFHELFRSWIAYRIVEISFYKVSRTVSVSNNSLLTSKLVHYVFNTIYIFIYVLYVIYIFYQYKSSS